MVVGTAALIWAANAKAEEQMITGPFCKTAEALETGWQYFADHAGATVPEVLAFVNGKLGEGTCGYGSFPAERKEDVKESDIGSKHYVSRVVFKLEDGPHEVFMGFGKPYADPA